MPRVDSAWIQGCSVALPALRLSSNSLCNQHREIRAASGRFKPTYLTHLSQEAEISLSPSRVWRWGPGQGLVKGAELAGRRRSQECIQGQELCSRSCRLQSRLRALGTHWCPSKHTGTSQTFKSKGQLWQWISKDAPASCF